MSFTWLEKTKVLKYTEERDAVTFILDILLKILDKTPFCTYNYLKLSPKDLENVR